MLFKYKYIVKDVVTVNATQYWFWRVIPCLPVHAGAGGGPNIRQQNILLTFMCMWSYTSIDVAGVPSD